MPLDIGPVTTTSNYADATFQGEWSSGYLFALGASALVEIAWGSYRAAQEQITDKRLLASQTLNFQAPRGRYILSVAVKSFVAGTPATVFGFFSEPDQIGIQTAIGSVV